MPKRAAQPPLSAAGQQALEAFAAALHAREDLRPVTLRNYLSDLRQFAAWYEETAATGQETLVSFGPAEITTPTVTRYRDYLQYTCGLKPASINRALITLKRYCAWAVQEGHLGRDPTRGVKMVGQEEEGAQPLTDTDEAALMKAVATFGSPRDQTLIVLMLHTGLRVQEVCQVKRADLTLNKRSGSVTVRGKRNKYREVPLNATVRKALEEYLTVFTGDSPYLFLSEKTGGALTERALGFVIKKYARAAKLPRLRPHDLRHRFGYRMAQVVPLHRLAQIMGHESLDTTMIYIKATKADLQQAVERIAWA
jgi:integrase/recombinase XerD